MTLFYRSLLGLLFVLTLGTGTSRAQRLGKFDTLVTFMDTTRKLACYAPSDYDPSKGYRLIVGLHGLGDNATNYRNAIVTTLNWATNFPNTIFVFPEAETINSDFYSPVGGESIVDSCIRFAMSNYHIDSSNVILQGFSLGGRAALRYGLENPEKVKGLLLNTPAIQGVKNALNEQPSYRYRYENASKLPIYITHGATDLIYGAPIDTAMKLMILEDGKVILNRIPKLGHTIPSFKQMPNLLQFFETPALVLNDIQLVEIEAPERTCSALMSPQVLLRNLGATVTNEIKIAYGSNGDDSRTITVPIPLAPFQHTYVQLPDVGFHDGQNSINTRVSLLNGNADTVTGNNSLSDTLEVALSSRPLPFAESFSGSFPPAGWTFERSGDYIAGFDIDGETGSDEPGSITAINTIFIFDNLGKHDAILTPSLDLTTIAQPALSFDMAFNFHRYTPPYFTDTIDFADTLEILISTDCGDSWQTLFRKGGADLSTFTEPILNPLNINQDLIYPEENDWRRPIIDLSSFGSATSAVLKFDYISALGGHLYIDNVRVQGPASVVNNVTKLSATIYPNPARDRLMIDGLTIGSQISVLDVMGREVLSALGMGGQHILDVSALTAGSYVLQIINEGTVRFEKFTVKR